MAITKLMHMKTASKGNPSAHLQNSIRYILDPKKCKEGILMYSNCGWNEGMVYRQMVKTKQLYGKNYGRQGYHFVLAFAPTDQVSPELAQKVTQEFCEQYLKNDYEYVCATHTNTECLHGHIVFNSLSRDGYKYHYKKGDWDKLIQPVTNSLCKKYGLTSINIEDAIKKRADTNQTKDYSKWIQDRPTLRKIICADLDEAIEQSGNLKGFLNIMREELHYEIRDNGKSRKHGWYFSFTAPGADRAVRSYTLPKGYSPEEICDRIANKEEYRGLFQTELTKENLRSMVQFHKPRYKMSVPQKMFYKRIYRLTSGHINRYPNSWKYKTQLLRVKKLEQEYNYLLKHNNIELVDDVRDKHNTVGMLINEMKEERKKCYRNRDIVRKKIKLALEFEQLDLIEPDSQNFEAAQARIEEIGDMIDLENLETLYIEDKRINQKLSDIKTILKEKYREYTMLNNIESDLKDIENGTPHKERNKQDRKDGTKVRM